MEALIPWKRLEKLVKRFYPNVQRGRPPYPLAVTVATFDQISGV
jgi:hypothetical protein